MSLSIKYFALITILFTVSILAQEKDYLNKNHLPQSLHLDKAIKQTYLVTTDYFNYDLKSNFIDKKRIEGKYTCGLGNDTVKWNDVNISESKDLILPFPVGEKQNFMENFKYVQDAEIIKPEFFKRIPSENYLVKNLFWDMLGFNVIAYSGWDSLTLNKDYHSKELSTEVNLSSDGTFENKDMILNWIGVTKINNALCAIIKYSTMNNPLHLKIEGLEMSGRSHYWGEIYVSLNNKQIEYATLAEDVITDVQINNQPQHILGYTVRKIVVSKL